MSRIPEEVLAVDRGLVVTLRSQCQDPCNEMNKVNGNQSRSSASVKLISYSYNPSLAKFMLCAQCDTDITKAQIIACCVIEDFATGTIHPCLLIEKTGMNVDDSENSNLPQTNLTRKDVRNGSFQYQVMFLISKNLKLVDVGSFSCETSLSKCKVWFMDGPTFCWEHNASLIVTKLRKDKPGIFQTEQLPSSLWSPEHSLHWCYATKGHLVVMATHPAREKSTSSNKWFDDMVAKKKWVVLHCNRQDLEKFQYVEMPIISNLYASIVSAVYMTTSTARSLTCKYTNYQLGDTCILAATTVGQLVAFNGGKVQRVCDLPFRDVCKILMLSRPSGGDLVVVKSQSGMACAVEWKTFKVIIFNYNDSLVLVL